MALTPRQTRQMQEDLAPHLDAIKGFFKPGALITVIVRRPDDPDGLYDFLIGDDEIPDAMNLLARRLAGERK